MENLENEYFVLGSPKSIDSFWLVFDAINLWIIVCKILKMNISFGKSWELNIHFPLLPSNYPQVNGIAKPTK